MSVDEFSSKFKGWTSQLQYNSIFLPELQISRQFINGLGAEFTTIRNSIPRPQGWDSHDVNTLTIKARDHLMLVHGNRDMNKRQREALRPSSNDPSPTSPTLSPTPVTPLPTTPSEPTRPRQRQP